MKNILFLIFWGCTLLGPVSVARAEVFKPAVVYHWSIEGNSYNVAIHKGVERFVAETGLACSEIVFQDLKDVYGSVVEKLARDGYSPIFLLYGSHYQEMQTLARKFPATRFIAFDAVMDEPNVFSFIISTQEGAFLAGALAAMASQSGIIGFVSVVESQSVRRFRCGYEQGAKYVNPEISLLVEFTGGGPKAWFNGNATAALANAMMDKGADVVFQVAGGAGPAVLEAVAKRGLLGIGVDVNQNGLYPGHVLTSVVKRADLATFAALMLARRGIWRDNRKIMGMAQGTVDIVFDEYNEPLISAEMRERIEQIKRDINIGDIIVPDYSEKIQCK